MGNEARRTNKETVITTETTTEGETTRNLTQRKDPEKTIAENCDDASGKINQNILVNKVMEYESDGDSCFN